MEKIVIIGSGPAGYTAAIYASRALLQPTLITGSLPGGQLTQTTDIENYPAYPDAISGFELMEAFKRQAEKFGTKIVFDNVESVDLQDGGPHKLFLGSGEQITTKVLIIATGASPKWLGLESEKRLMAKGVSACATCDGAFFKNQIVAVVGGGDTAMEEAIFLTRFASKVYVIHRRDKLRASKIMAERAMKNPKIEFIFNSVVIDILGENQVEGLRVKNLISNQVSEFKINGYFAALGHMPNTSMFKGKLEMDEYGYIITKEPGTRTNINGVFAAGDCADRIFRQAITAAGMGCKAAIEAERWLETENV